MIPDNNDAPIFQEMKEKLQTIEGATDVYVAVQPFLLKDTLKELKCVFMAGSGESVFEFWSEQFPTVRVFAVAGGMTAEYKIFKLIKL